MKKYLFFIASLFVLLSSCKTYYTVENTKSSFNKIDKKLDGKGNSDIDNIIAPYKDKLSKKMNEVLGYSDGLSKKQPESTLGNWIADAIVDGAERISSMKVDFAIQNYGGVRIKDLAEGEITLGKIYELMPFNNYVVILKADGAVTKQLLDLMASRGGWPISKSVHYKIEGDKAVDIFINGEPFDENKTYIIALPDYIANGGDKCYFLKDAEKIDTDQVLIRDILAEEVQIAAKNGKHINAKIEGRVIK